MEKILITALLSIIPFTSIAHPHEEDPYTTYIQEKLIELGYLDVANGMNDKKTQSAIKLFQLNSDIFVDGMVGDETFKKLFDEEDISFSNVEIESSSIKDEEPPVWDSNFSLYADEIYTLFNLNLPSVTDNVGVTSIEVYVNGALSSHANISETRLLVTPKYDMTCSDQVVFVIAYDAAGNSSQSPHITFNSCSSASSSASSVSAVFSIFWF